ncbi:MAG: hypothetical protein ACYTET_06195 [Planctomycetota bacterium]|jgi:hypothetical protein
MKKTGWALLAVFVLISSFSVAAPLNYKHVSGQARWAFHVDFEAFRGSEMGQLVQTSMQETYQDKINAMAQLLGTDLTQDLNGITVYGQTGSHENAAALFDGTFDQNKLLSLLVLNGAYSKSIYNDHTLHHWVDESRQRNQVGTFATDSLIIIAETEDSVKGALDVLSGKQKTLADENQTLLERLNKAPDQAIMVMAAEGLSELTNGNPHAAVLKNSDVMAAVIAEENGNMKLQVDLEAETPEAAVQIEQVLLGMKAFMMLGSEQYPQLPEVLSQAVLVRDEKQLSLAIQYPSIKLFELFQSLEPADVEALVEEDHSPDAGTHH